MTDPLALLIGMLLDQQVPMEWAFKGPATLKERLGGTLDAAAIAAMSRGRRRRRVRGQAGAAPVPRRHGQARHELCQFLVDNYDGDAGAVWRDVTDGDELYRRVRALPGYGDEKAKIFIAILAKRLGEAPDRLGARRPRRSPTTPLARSPTSTRPSRWPRCASSRR